MTWGGGWRKWKKDSEVQKFGMDEISWITVDGNLINLGKLPKMTAFEKNPRLKNPITDLNRTNIQYCGTKPERMNATPSIAPDTRTMVFLPCLGKLFCRH